MDFLEAEELLAPMVESKNFGAILNAVEAGHLRDVAAQVAAAVYDELKDLDGEADLCLEILQRMMDKEWSWSPTDASLDALVPLRRALDRLAVPKPERNKFYRCTACADVVGTRGDVVTLEELTKALS